MRKKFKEALQELVLEQIQYQIDEFDIEAEVKKFNISKAVAEEIRTIILDKISKSIETKIFTEVQKKQPLIDAFVANNVAGFIYGFEKYVKEVTNKPSV